MSVARNGTPDPEEEEPAEDEESQEVTPRTADESTAVSDDEEKGIDDAISISGFMMFLPCFHTNCYCSGRQHLLLHPILR